MSFIQPSEPQTVSISTINVPPPVDEAEEQFRRFIHAIGEFESDGMYEAVNRFGYLGKYQFSPKTIKHLGYGVSDEDFLKDTLLQNEVMEAYVYENYYVLRDYIDRYDNTRYKGMEITTASILAGAHFAGAYGMKRFLDTVEDSLGTIDSNGTSLRNYMAMFSDFDIDLEGEEQ